MQTNARKCLAFSWIGVLLLLPGPAQAWPWDPDLPSDPLAPLALLGSNINISHFADNEVESAVAINPLNPKNVVVFSNYETTDALFRAYSFDGGFTWTGGSILPGACCDANAAFDSYGNLFLTYLDTGVELTYSTDGGVTFATPVTLAELPPGNLPGFNSKSLGSGDQPSLAVGPSSVAGQGAVWVCWSSGMIRVRGAPVTGLGAVGSFTTAVIPPTSTGNFGDIAVGPAGQVMVTYMNPTGGQGPATIYVNTDPDGFGASPFGSRVAVTTTNVGGFDFIPAQSGRSVDAEAGLAFDRTGGPHNGRVYMVYTEETVAENNDTEILLRYSDDNGATWSGPAIRVNDDATTRSQFNPHISFDQSTGLIAISFHDCRNDGGVPGSGSTNFIVNDDAMYYGTWAYYNAGAALTIAPNFQIAAGVSNDDAAANGIDYGDYTGMDFKFGRFFPAWADNSNSTGDNPDGTLSRFDLYGTGISIISVVTGPGGTANNVRVHMRAP